MRFTYIAGILLLAACQPKIEDCPIIADTLDLTAMDQLIEDGVEFEDLLDDSAREFYLELNIDSTIEDYVYIPHDTVEYAIISFYTTQSNHFVVRNAIEEIMDSEGYRYLIDNRHDFEVRLAKKLDSVSYLLGEVEIFSKIRSD